MIAGTAVGIVEWMGEGLVVQGRTTTEGEVV